LQKTLHREGLLRFLCEGDRGQTKPADHAVENSVFQPMSDPEFSDKDGTIWVWILPDAR